MSYFDDNEDRIIYGRQRNAPRTSHTCRYCGAPVFFVKRGGTPIDAKTCDPHRCKEREDHIRAQALAGFEVLDD